MKNRHFGGRVLLGTSRESTKMWQILGCLLRVSRILVSKAFGDTVLQVLEKKARKKLPNRPVFTHMQGPPEAPLEISFTLIFSVSMVNRVLRFPAKQRLE